MRAMNDNVSRRKLLIGCALGALTPCVLNRIALAETPDLADFIRLSAELTGRSRLSVDAARTYLQALGLARGALNGTETQEKGSDSLARRIVADWYSGQTVDAGRMICVDYTGALMWDAIGFARPGGVPGEAASWALAPTKE
jgi:hypothetical protein